MAGFIPNQVATNVLAGQRHAQDVQYGNRRNVLADQSIARNQQVMEQEDAAGKAEAQKAMATRLFQAAQYGLQNPQPKTFIEQNFPELAQAAGPKWATATDDDVRSELQNAIGRLGPQAGIAPAPPKPKFTTTAGPRGSIIQTNPETGEQKQVVGPDNTQPAAPRNTRFRPLSAQEISSYGLPPGSSAQVNDETGQVQVLNKPSVAPQQSAAERKAMIEAKVKMPRVSAAMRRAERLDQAITAVGKNMFLDGGPADAKALQYTKEGREVIAAAAQLMPELSALTRVPGIGSQSDLEARLASLAMPSLEFDPETNARSMAELHAFIADLKAAYETIASGGAPANEVPDEAGPAVPAAPSGWSIRPL